jgi:hypothetical protein
MSALMGTGWGAGAGCAVPEPMDERVDGHRSPWMSALMGTGWGGGSGMRRSAGIGQRGGLR